MNVRIAIYCILDIVGYCLDAKVDVHPNNNKIEDSPQGHGYLKSDAILTREDS